MSIETLNLLIMPVGALLLGLFVAFVAMRTARHDLQGDAAEADHSAKD